MAIGVINDVSIKRPISEDTLIFFLTPTAQFILGVLYYDEPLVLHKLISFIFIWVAVIIYLNELRKE